MASNATHFTTKAQDIIFDFSASAQYSHALIFASIYNIITFLSFLFFLYYIATFLFYCFKGTYKDIILESRKEILKLCNIQILKFLKQHYAFRLYPVIDLILYSVIYKMPSVFIALIFREIAFSLFFDFLCVVIFFFNLSD